MEIIVLVKQAPDAPDVSFKTPDSTIKREGVTSNVCLMDKNAVEAALKLREGKGGKITIVTLGGSYAKTAVKEAIAMGADEGVLITEDQYKGSDALATAQALALAIKKNGSYNIILAGRQSDDGNTSLVPPAVAQFLGIEHIPNVNKIVEVNGDTAIFERVNENGTITIEAKLPVVISCEQSMNEPRYPTVKGTMKANKKQIPVWSADDIGADSSKLGLANAACKLLSLVETPPRQAGEKISGDSPEELAANLVNKLVAAKVI